MSLDNFKQETKNNRMNLEQRVKLLENKADKDPFTPERIELIKNQIKEEMKEEVSTLLPPV